MHIIVPYSYITEGKICFSHFTLFLEWNVKKLFCKTNIKLLDLYRMLLNDLMSLSGVASYCADLYNIEMVNYFVIKKNTKTITFIYLKMYKIKHK